MTTTPFGAFNARSYGQAVYTVKHQKTLRALNFWAATECALTKKLQFDCNPFRPLYTGGMIKSTAKPRFRVRAGRTGQLVALPPKATPRPKRFKVQHRVELTAHDNDGKRFVLGETWRTVIQADKQTTAERQLMHKIHDEPRRTWRIVEEWPIGSNLRVIR